MIEKRLFTFGCSHTSYHWPSWADMIGIYYKEYYNHGKTGAGNFFILSQLFECHEYYKFTKDDIILIMLSEDNRGDFILPNNNWSCTGGIFNNANVDLFGMKFLENVWTENHCINQGWVLTQSINVFLKLIGCDFKIYSAFFHDNKFHNDENQQNITERKIRYLSGEPLMKYKNHTNSYHFPHDETNKKVKDDHLTITEHYNWVKKNASEYAPIHKIRDIINTWEENITYESRLKIRKKFQGIFVNHQPNFVLGTPHA